MIYGYLINNATYLDLSGTEGYSDELFFPHKETYGSCSGYWLAGPLHDSTGSDRVMGIHNNGQIYNAEYSYQWFSVRPVVCLPTNYELELNSTTGVFNIVTK